jgi:hypothetical protein
MQVKAQAAMERKGIMTSSETDRLCRDWLRENCWEEITSEYKHYSLLVPVRNSPELNDGSETPRQALCIALGPDESFGSIDYYEARRRLGLSEHCTSIPEVFTKAFAGT